ncbi:hypothetical protein LSH36_144g04044 [Paralvinella palmiformis]|uniref:UspA domain-containing protein n=1 Tax=Paralvinella palmiformis TaxID=53620 RepID=A0AAD9JV52_9ANNE|nr:hypothetical protein LSH36_144g04044 [Paralvinella palmiformis]
MGGWQSTSGSANKTVNMPLEYNNNDGDTVIIPVDASQQAEAAFLWYVNHVHRPENTVRILHCQEVVQSTPMLAEHAFRTDSWVDLMERAREQGQNIISKYDKKLEEHNIKGSVIFEVGKPGETVIDAAEKNRATMIVMGTRGFGLVRRTILGSVSEYVIHHTKVPVTVVPKETQSWFF